MTQSPKMTAKELADHLGTTPRRARSFLRKHAEVTPGSGNRWEIARKDLPEIETAFDSWAKGASTTFAFRDED